MTDQSVAPLGLVADIGRQSVRFALAGGAPGPAPRAIERVATADHATFTDALLAYLARAGLRDAALPSVLAVAGLPRGDVVNPTGSRWFISLTGVEAVLRVRPRAINDFAAGALALQTLPAAEFRALHGTLGVPKRGGIYLVVGAGTGLGVAALVPAGGGFAAVQSEAAHMCFAPRSPADTRLVEQLRRAGPTVSNEAVLSGGGLVAAWRAAGGASTVAQAEEVTRLAVRDPTARAALDSFAGALGAVVGDLVLAFGAWDGVYLTGAIAQAIAPTLAGPAFRDRMVGGGPHRRQLGQVPVALVGRGDLELIGAAAALAG